MGTLNACTHILIYILMHVHIHCLHVHGCPAFAIKFNGFSHSLDHFLPCWGCNTNDIYTYLEVPLGTCMYVCVHVPVHVLSNEHV